MNRWFRDEKLEKTNKYIKLFNLNTNNSFRNENWSKVPFLAIRNLENVKKIGNVCCAEWGYAVAWKWSFHTLLC